MSILPTCFDASRLTLLPASMCSSDQCHIDSRAAAAELTPLRSVRPSYRLLRLRCRENLYPAGTSHFPRPWAGHVRRSCPPVRLFDVSHLIPRPPQLLALCDSNYYICNKLMALWQEKSIRLWLREKLNRNISATGYRNQHELSSL